MKQRRGSTMVTTLFSTALIATLGFGLAGLAVSHISAETYQEDRHQAEQLARSAMSTAIARLMQDTDFGKHPSPSGGDLIEVHLEGARSGSVGMLTFRPELAEAQHLACSTNNFEESKGTQGSGGRVVPQNSAYLVAEGRCGGVTRRVEAVLAVPPFPYAIAASGSIRADGGITIGALSSIPTGNIPDSSTFLPADLLSNDATEQSVFLGAETHISGDVRSAGLISLDPSAPANSIQVKGQLRSQSSPEKIPSIDLSHYDPVVSGIAYTELTEASYGDGQTKLGGVSRHQGPMRVTQGLYLDGGVVFVDGDLSIFGGLSGKGTLAVNGNVKIVGQADLQSGNGVALLAARNLSISGSDPGGSYFQGLIYTQGSFAADKVTLVGSLVASGDPNPVTLHDVRAFSPPPAVMQAVTTTTTGTGRGDLIKVFTDNPHGETTLQAPSTSEGGQRGGTVSMDDSGQTEGGHPLYRLVFRIEPGGQFTLMKKLSDWSALKDEHGAFAAQLISLGYLTREEVERQSEAWTNVLRGLDQVRRPFHEDDSDSSPDPRGGAGAVVTTIDPSSFLKLNERIRIVMWKEE